MTNFCQFFNKPYANLQHTIGCRNLCKPRLIILFSHLDKVTITMGMSLYSINGLDFENDVLSSTVVLRYVSNIKYN